jgi:signal transduction histidine kinase/ActR/RegA family two-component response regulator
MSDEDVLVAAPYGRDGDIIQRLLGEAGVAARACADVTELCARFVERPRVMVLTEEALPDVAALDRMRACVESQPPWSDAPLLLLCHSGEGGASAYRLRTSLFPANIAFLERPARLRVFVSAVESALRAQRRQHELKTILADLERAGRVKDEFLAVVSHELRTPLNAILGWSHMLRAGLGDPKALSHGLESIERNAKAQAHLIDDLLDVSRIISGKLRLALEPISPRDCVEVALETARPAANARGVSLSLSEEGGLGRIVADPTRLQQIAWNLVSNALKFTPPGGSVDVSLTREHDVVELRVRDTGEGILPEFLPFVFDRFRQHDSSTTRAHGGLGLGLAIVKNLVEMHGGTVSVSSDGAGRGSTFVVRLPAVATRDPAPAGLGRCGIADGAGGERIDGVRVLVVDDEADTRDVLGRLLEAHGATARLEASSKAALLAIEEFDPMVIVADIGMRGEDGYAFVRRVRARDKARARETPAIALTAYARDTDRARSIREGFDVHLPKPVDLGSLVSAIARAARREF